MSCVRVIIGQVQGAHGVRGELKIKPLTDFPERFLSMAELSLYRKGESAGSYAIRGIRDVPDRGYFLVSLQGVDDRDQADALRGCTVEIPPEERIPLAPGEFWISDLIGLDAFDDNGAHLGTVRDMVANGSSDLMVIRDNDGKDHLIPAAPQFFLKADLAERRVTLHLIEGLWEL
ncbi:MAG: ribosome maturation factor RimM [Pyramidobacter sp.]|jgi:16S rRNA processing protein RimM